MPGSETLGYLVLLWRFSHFSLLTGLVTFVHVLQRAALRSAAALHDLQLRSAELSRRALESRLKAMQARVDPQFLFDTLARVEQLRDREPAKADRVLGDLIVYLRAALPLVKETASTLATEFDLLRAYLNIVRAERTGLSFDLSLPEALGAMRIPPMLLLPLVELFVARSGDVPARALDMGIAARCDDELAITVVGRDMALATATIDAAVDPIRERLAALFGTGASLEVRQHAQGRLEARLGIPYAYAVGADR
jgi:LytS/YehU family sensor histidine kinase